MLPKLAPKLPTAVPVGLIKLHVVISTSNHAVRAALLLSTVRPRLRAVRAGLASRSSHLLIVVCCASLVAGASVAPFAAGTPRPGHHASATSPRIEALEHPTAPLPVAVNAPLPAPPTLVAQGPLQPHEIFGFAPYWTLDRARGFDLRSLSTIAYFGVDVAPDGSLVRSGAGWDGYQSQALADLISSAHGHGVRMVLTLKAFDPNTLHRLANDPAAPNRMATEVVQAMRDKSFDGLNLDLEGDGPQERATLAALVRGVAGAVHAANHAYQVTVDTYGSSASDANNWFDVAAMAPAVDAFFVMAYDMYHADYASPNAPLQGTGTTFASAGAAYAQLVGRSKVILGTPYYGYEFDTQDNQPASHASGDHPTPVDYATIKAAARPENWDADHLVPWTAYQTDGKWHVLYYDNPTSLALKARAASALKLLGVGVWALGMDGNDPAMMAALLGRAKPVKNTPAPVASAAPAAPAAHPTAPGAGPKPSPTPTASPSPSPSPPLPDISPPVDPSPVAAPTA